MKIAIAGRRRRGKTTSARLISDMLVGSTGVISIAEKLKAIYKFLTQDDELHTSIQSDSSDKPNKVRRFYQELGRIINDYDAGLLVRHAIRRSNEDRIDHAVIDDVRRLSEAYALRKAGFTIITIRGPYRGLEPLSDEIDNDPTETEPDAIAELSDHVIMNDGTIEDLRDALRLIIPKAFIAQV